MRASQDGIEISDLPINIILLLKMHWLVTGCSSGLGLSLSRVIASQPGQKLTATSRNPGTTPDAVKEITSHEDAAWVTLDVSSTSLESDLSAIISKHGPIDVLINNAGYAVGGALEAISLDVIRQQYETNFFGVVRMIQATLPSMRASAKGGVIVNVSSAEFWNPHPGTSVYSSSKWAVEGLSAALAGEVASFGVRILIAEPGAMRTSFITPDKTSAQLSPFPEAYVGTPAEYVMGHIAAAHGSQQLDPEKAARAIVYEVLNPTMIPGEGGQSPKQMLRLQLGRECIEDMKNRIADYSTEWSAGQEQALACDFDA